MTPVVSVVVVFNDQALLARRLEAGLERQRGIEWELIAVDNRDGRFRSAVHALEDGAARARGSWVAFAHQDVELLSPDWLRDATGALDPVGELGWAGAAGVDEAGRFRGLLVDAGMVRGEHTGALDSVQTLDECLLVTRRRDGGYFDPALPGWHAYGVDACLSALRAGRRNVALPFPIWHDSRSTNLAGLDEARAWIVAKHGSWFPVIRTTTGALPEMLEHRAGGARSLALRVGRRVRADALRVLGWKGGYRVWLGEILERDTEGADVDVFRPLAPFGALDARGFVHQPIRPRSVRHLFGGAVAAARPGTRRVVWHDRIAQAQNPSEDVARLVENSVGALVVVEVDVLGRRPELERWLRARAAERTLAVDLDDRHLAVYRVEPAPS